MICFCNHRVKHFFKLLIIIDQIKRNGIPSWRSDLFIKEFWLRKLGFIFLGIKICFWPNICKHFIVKIDSWLGKIFAVRVRIEDFFLSFWKWKHGKFLKKLTIIGKSKEIFVDCTISNRCGLLIGSIVILTVLIKACKIGKEISKTANQCKFLGIRGVFLFQKSENSSFSQDFITFLI